MKMLKVASLLSIILVLAVPVNARQRVTLADCVAAIQLAQMNDDKWQAPFSMDECAVVAKRVIGIEAVLKNHNLSDNEKARAIRKLGAN